ncbi:LysE family translocator [Uliginosibacterium sp. H1]|uniref:LysE family translocator n=1 Tax=Uliginosibacterium sp. H1 TaxID=3114757 RepID=UPI002E196361|nr:LysE family translocator [Uliginosibacterium sp. H1]
MMSGSSLFAFVLFVFATSATPGPNNVMLLASGVNFGVRATLPHLLGISSGVAMMLVAVALGLSQVFADAPHAHGILRWVGAAYLLYLALRLALSTSAADHDAGKRSQPMGFWSAVAFQWVNPKAWIMVLGACSSYLPSDSSLAMVAGFSLLFALINMPSAGMWAVFGQHLRQFLGESRRRRRFNLGMAALLVLSLWPVLGASAPAGALH